MFLPTTKEEMKKLGWSSLDVIIVSGDTYIDTYYDGAALIGKLLAENGYRVGIIAQPDIKNDRDIKRLGEPELFWGVTSGCVDSMVANYTALKKKRRSDDFTPGGENNRRPDRAVLKYTNLIRQHFKNTRPIVLGGIEASLRRIAHYDYWSDSLRRSILIDAKADYLLYGMADKSVIELADSLKNNNSPKYIRGLSYISNQPPENYLELPSFENVSESVDKFMDMFQIFYENSEPLNSKGLFQKHSNRYVVQNPPALYSTEKELDKVYELKFERDVHPYYKKMGKVKALDTIQFSITTHRGCYGECNFCAIAIHQGRGIRSRSVNSIINEAESFKNIINYKGIISDLGGPTANMYGNSCEVEKRNGACKNKRCLSDGLCKSMNIDHYLSLKMLKGVKKIHKNKKAFVNSGIRYDIIILDEKNGDNYLMNIVQDHTSGQMKIAPEHVDSKILKLMGKPADCDLKKFVDKFYEMTKKAGKKQFLTYYFIAAHPGCTKEDMLEMKDYINRNLKVKPEQVQIFTPTPSTFSTLMYYVERNFYNRKKLFVEKNNDKKNRQKSIIIGKY